MNTPTVTVRQWERDEADVVSSAQEVTVSYSNNEIAIADELYTVQIILFWSEQAN